MHEIRYTEIFEVSNAKWRPGSQNRLTLNFFKMWLLKMSKKRESVFLAFPARFSESYDTFNAICCLISIVGPLIELLLAHLSWKLIFDDVSFSNIVNICVALRYFADIDRVLHRKSNLCKYLSILQFFHNDPHSRAYKGFPLGGGARVYLEASPPPPQIKNI